jgi:hypothetical protein
MSQSAADIQTRTAILLIAIFVVTGFVLRCLAAQGGLWTDEAWSLIYAQQAGDALGVLTRINHDNNHHINSWWLQLVGSDASPMLMRGLSIITSSIMIGVAALIGLRRNRITGVITAALFALSPIMLVYGSEARGYAPMMLAFMIMIWRIDIWLDDQLTPKPALLLALCALFGSFSHLAMLPAVIMLGLWVFLAGAKRWGILHSIKVMADLLSPALAVSVLGISTVIIIATHSETGLQVGGYAPFLWPIFALAISNLISFATGIGYAGDLSAWMILAIAAVGAAMWLTRWQIPAARKWFYAILILTMPVAVGILGLGNSQYPRYYLPAAAAILLLLAEWIGQFAIQRKRISAAIILSLMLGLATIQDYQLIVSQRGQPERAVDIMAKIAPKGANVTIAAERASAILKVAAAAMRYPLNISLNKCSAADFHFIAGMAQESETQILRDCGPSMRLIAFDHTIGPSGESWSLYQRQALQRPIVAVSSALPRQ